MKKSESASVVTRLSPRTKLFVLDTNVLMHDPTSLFHFEEHDIYIPMATLEELDTNKKGMSGSRVTLGRPVVFLTRSSAARLMA
jgi:PhoH-like ATPase